MKGWGPCFRRNTYCFATDV